VTKLPVLVKGVAVDHGASGIILVPDISARLLAASPICWSMSNWDDAILEEPLQT
jgi:hypothetical protein